MSFMSIFFLGRKYNRTRVWILEITLIALTSAATNACGKIDKTRFLSVTSALQDYS
jgi:hypothetical protein